MMQTIFPILFLHLVNASAQITIQHSQSFDGARIQMLNGKREEALTILKDLYYPRHDLKAQSMIENFSTQFLNQDSESLYFQAINLIGARKFPEAKDKLNQANTKDANHVLVLLRLSQVERELGQFELAEEHVKAAIKLNPFNRDLKIMLAMIKISQSEDQEAFKIFETYKSHILSTPELWFEYYPLLKRVEKNTDLENIKKRVLSSKKPSILEWMVLMKDENLKPNEQKIGQSVLTKCTQEIDKCVDGIEQGYKKLQFLWMPKEDLGLLLKKLSAGGSVPRN